MFYSKKIVCLVISMFMAFTLFNADIHASDEAQITVNGALLKTDVAPVIINDRLMVPLRAIFEAIGSKVEWIDSTKTILGYKDDITIKLQIDNPTAEVNGKTIELDAAPAIIDSRTMVPLRFVAESFAAKVGWDGFTGTASVNYTPYLNKVTEIKSPPLNIPGEHTWKVLDTNYCRIYFYQDDEYVLQSVKKLDAIYEKLDRKLGHRPATSSADNYLIPVYFVDETSFSIYFEKFSPNAAAIWFSKDRAMFINLKTKNNVTKPITVTFAHEFTHSITVSSSDFKLKNTPGWLIEGIAAYYGYYNLDNDTKETNITGTNFLKSALKSGKILPWSSLKKSAFYWDPETMNLGYAQAESVVTFLMEKYGQENIGNLFYVNGDAAAALEKVTAKSLEELENDWRKYIEEKFK